MTPLRLERLAALGDAGPEWDALAERAGNVFATPAWTTAWWRHFGAGRPLLSFAARDADGRLAALLPLYLAARRPVRIARFLGHGPGDQLGPVCAPGDRPAAADALRRALAEPGVDWDVLLAERLPGDEGWTELLGATPLRREPSPVLLTEGRTWDEYLADRSSNFRQQVRRAERKLQREAGLTYRLADDPARLDADLDLLYRLHEARWGDAGSGALAGARGAFHREFAAEALERGWLRLWFAELDGTPAAALYCLRYAGDDWYYQAGRDPAREDTRVGFVLLAHTVRQAFEDGMRAYRFLLGGESYKSRFTEVDPGLDTVTVARGAAGRLAAAGMRGMLRLPPAARRRLPLGRMAA